MAQTVADVMTRDPETVDVSRPVAEAARIMRDADTGALVVTDNGRVADIVTDRDITVRVVAEHNDPSTPLREACSAADLATVGPDTSIDQAGLGSGHGQRLVVGYGLAGEQVGRATGHPPEVLGVALQQRDPPPSLQGLEQLGEIEALPGLGERPLVVGGQHALDGADDIAGKLPGNVGRSLGELRARRHSRDDL